MTQSQTKTQSRSKKRTTPGEPSKAQKVYDRLRALHPDAHIELDFTTPLDLLVATILSAQCTDARVNIVTRELFRRARTPDDYLGLGTDQLEAIIQSAGFYRQKAKSILGTMRKIRDDFHGEIPRSMEELVQLPGVGRKTANVVLGNAFDTPGLPVDTHVTRLSLRLGLTQSEDPVTIEAELQQVLSPLDWTMFSHTLIFHGRRVCKARRPECARCNATDLCLYYQTAEDAVIADRKKARARTQHEGT